MKVKYFLLGSALLALSANAMAAADKTGRGYVGALYTMLTLSPDGAPDYDLAALGVRGGYYFNKYFSVEGRLAVGTGDDTQVGIKVELNNVYGVYAVGHLPLSEKFQLYGLVGYTKQDVTLTDVSIPVSVDDDDSDFSYGVGLEFDMTNNLSLGAEYVSYFSNGEVLAGTYDTTGIGIHLNYLF